MWIRQDSCLAASYQDATAKAAERRNPRCDHRVTPDQRNLWHVAVPHIDGVADNILDVCAHRYTRRSKGLHGSGIPDELQSTL